MTENRGRRRRPNRPKGQGQGQGQQRGRMRSLSRPQSQPQRQDQQQGRDSRDSSYRGRDRPTDGVTKRRIRDDRIFGALCHAGIFLGIWGLATTAVIWAFRKDRSRVLRFQGAQALFYQFVAQAVLLLGTLAGVLWASDLYKSPEAVSKALQQLGSAGFLVGLAQQHFIPLTALYALFGFVASLLLLLCLLGLEPSYPIIGGLTRRALGLREAPPSSTEAEAKDDATLDANEAENEATENDEAVSTEEKTD